jgi:hypothetical protein
MDEQQLRQIVKALAAYPPAWDEDESLAYEAMAVAAAKEAAGEPVEITDPQLAAFLSRNPDAVLVYADLVIVEEEALAEAEPAVVPVLRSAQEWLRRSLAEIEAAFTPMRLNYGGLRGATISPQQPGDERKGSIELRGQQLSVTVTLRVRDERGSIYLQLVPMSGSQRPGIAGAEAALFEAVQQSPLVAGGTTHDIQPIKQGYAYFSGLDPERGYVIAIAVPDEELIIVAIAASEWPEW